MMWILLVLHLLTVVMLLRWLYARGRQHRQALPSWFMLGSIALFLPVLGSAMLWLFSQRHLIPLRDASDSASGNNETEDFIYVFESPKRDLELRLEQGDERLNALNIDSYLDLLMSSRELAGKPAVALLKQALGCKAENARLLAYALYSKKEQGLFQILDEMLDQFKQGQMTNPRLNLAIAQMYWHMLDIDMVDPAIAPDMWEKLYVHACLVVKYEPSLWQPYWLLAQADLNARRYAPAKMRFIKALAAGADKSRVEPFLFEIQSCLRRELSLA